MRETEDTCASPKTGAAAPLWLSLPTHFQCASIWGLGEAHTVPELESAAVGLHVIAMFTHVGFAQGSQPRSGFPPNRCGQVSRVQLDSLIRNAEIRGGPPRCKMAIQDGVCCVLCPTFLHSFLLQAGHGFCGAVFNGGLKPCDNSHPSERSRRSHFSCPRKTGAWSSAVCEGHERDRAELGSEVRPRQFALVSRS